VGPAVALSIVANGVLLWVAFTQNVDSGFSAFDWPTVTFLAVPGAAGATAASRVGARRSVRSVRRFAITAAVVLVLSSVPGVVLPPGTSGATTLGIGVLVLLYAVVAGIRVGVPTGVGGRR